MILNLRIEISKRTCSGQARRPTTLVGQPAPVDIVILPFLKKNVFQALIRRPVFLLDSTVKGYYYRIES